MADVSSDVLSGLGLTGYSSPTSTGSSSATTTTDSADTTDTAGAGVLGQTDFLKLMIAQLNNQDPMKPMDNGEFLGQMAQFSTVTGIEELTKAFGTLSQSLGQGLTLQAASLVGKDVLVPGSSMEISEGQPISGAFELDASAGSVTVEVADAAGQVVRTIDLGQLSAGLQEFTWDGLTGDGSPAPAGTYSIKATAQTGGISEALTTLLTGQVSSVSLDNSSGGVKLSVKGIGDVAVSDLYRIG